MRGGGALNSHFRRFSARAVVCKQLFTAAEQARISAEFNATIDEYQPPPIALETPAEYQKRVGEVGVGVSPFFLSAGAWRCVCGSIGSARTRPASSAAFVK